MAFHKAVLRELQQDPVKSSRGRGRPRGVKRKMSSYKVRSRGELPKTRLDYATAISIIK